MNTTRADFEAWLDQHCLGKETLTVDEKRIAWFAWRDSAELIAQERDELDQRVAELTLQLPKGMKHCKIKFKECPKGHGRLTATNWVQHGCMKCENDRLQQERDELAAQVEVMRDIAEDAAGIDAVGLDPVSELGCKRRLADKARKTLVVSQSAALREIQARTLEEAMDEVASMPIEEARHSAATEERILALLRKMAAAKREAI